MSSWARVLFLELADIVRRIDIEEGLGMSDAVPKSLELLFGGRAGLGLAPWQALKQVGGYLSESEQVVTSVFTGAYHCIALVQFYQSVLDDFLMNHGNVRPNGQSFWGLMEGLLQAETTSSKTAAAN